MVSETAPDEPVDLANFRAQREARKEEHRRQKARDHVTAEFPDYGREIPPRVNPDVLDMLDEIKACYVSLTESIARFQDEVGSLAEAGKLDPNERAGLFGHYRHLEEAVAAATADVLKFPVLPDFRGRINDSVHRLVDHAKYVYAVGSRDIAALQYRFAELAHTGRLDFEVSEHLEWHHCLPMWEMLYSGTLSAVHDQGTWDGGWEWDDNTYSDGRQVMVQVRLKNWPDLERNWPYNRGMCGDGAINEHPRASICRIAPVHDPDIHHFRLHPAVEIEPDELIELLGPPPLDPETLNDLAIKSMQDSAAEEPWLSLRTRGWGSRRLAMSNPRCPNIIHASVTVRAPRLVGLLQEPGALRRCRRAARRVSPAYRARRRSARCG